MKPQVSKTGYVLNCTVMESHYTKVSLTELFITLSHFLLI